MDAYCGFTDPAAEALAAHGVGHVVGVSALGRGTPVADRAGLVTVSLAVDDLIAKTGVSYRALANPSFFENFLEEADSIREKGVFTDVLDADRKAPSSPSPTSPPSPPACCWTAPGPTSPTSRFSGPRTCHPTTWPAS